MQYITRELAQSDPAKFMKLLKACAALTAAHTIPNMFYILRKDILILKTVYRVAVPRALVQIISSQEI